MAAGSTMSMGPNMGMGGVHHGYEVHYGQGVHDGYGLQHGYGVHHRPSNAREKYRLKLCKGSTMGTDYNMGTEFTIDFAIQENKSIYCRPISSTPIKIAHSVQNCIFRF